MSVVSQLARCETEIGRSAGTWTATGNGALSAEIDETFSDGLTTEFGSPTTVATHTCTLKFGANWNGAPLARPADNTMCVLEAHLRLLNLIVVQEIDLVEGATTNTDGTVRDSWTGLFATMTSSYQRFRRVLSSAVVDAISDFTALSLRFRIVVNNAGRGGLCTYAHLEMPGASAAANGQYVEDWSTTGSTPMARCWTLHSGASLVIPTPPTMNNEVNPTDSVSTLQIFRCHALYLPADSYAEVTVGAGYDPTLSKLTPFIRHKRNFTGDTDQLRYNVVPAEPQAPNQYQYKRDGGPSSPILVTADATGIGLAEGVRLQTRAVSDTYTGWHDGTQIMTTTGDANGNLPLGHQGFVLVPFAGIAGGVRRFEMSSVTNDPSWTPQLGNQWNSIVVGGGG